MSLERFVSPNLLQLYEIHDWRNGLAVLSAACPEEWGDIKRVLEDFRLFHTDVAQPGGNLSPISIRLNRAFKELGWKERKFDTRIVVDDVEHASPTHKVDHFKGRVALEIEWNNKDPFYDRDLNNFRLLFDLRVIDAGVIVTRTRELNRLAVELGKTVTSLGASTTHLGKLLPRLNGGSGGGCPVTVFGIRKTAYVDDRPEPPATTGGRCGCLKPASSLPVVSPLLRAAVSLGRSLPILLGGSPTAPGR